MKRRFPHLPEGSEGWHQAQLQARFSRRCGKIVDRLDGERPDGVAADVRVVMEVFEGVRRQRIPVERYRRRGSQADSMQAIIRVAARSPQ